MPFTSNHSISGGGGGAVVFAHVHHGVELWLASSWLEGNNKKRSLSLVVHYFLLVSYTAPPVIPV